MGCLLTCKGFNIPVTQLCFGKSLAKKKMYKGAMQRWSTKRLSPDKKYFKPFKTHNSSLIIHNRLLSISAICFTCTLLFCLFKMPSMCIRQLMSAAVINSAP